MFTRAELAAAFETFEQTVDRAAQTHDWDAWTQHYTDDVLYIEHAAGTMHGRDEVRTWIRGTMGAFLTGILATADVNANLNLNLKDIVGKTLWLEQVKAIGLTLALAVVGTTIIAFIVKAVIGLRASEEVETVGLDLTEHGEEGYTGA